MLPLLSKLLNVRFLDAVKGGLFSSYNTWYNLLSDIGAPSAKALFNFYGLSFFVKAYNVLSLYSVALL